MRRQHNSSPSARQLIEARLTEMPDMPGDMDTEYHYTCMDTGMVFETYGDVAQFSPFTGSTNISMTMAGAPVGEQDASDYLQPTSIPPSQKNPTKQVPLEPNPIEPEPPDSAWKTKQLSANPADPDAPMGDDQANPTTGYVSYKPVTPPPYVDRKPGERT